MAVDVVYQGGKFAQRGYDMYREVERLTSFDIFVSQGGYNVDGVAASAGTHDREAVDVSGSVLTSDERWTVCKNMRRVGFAAWIRTPAQGFSYHIHGVPINGDLSTAARAQVVQYLDKKNGLKGAGPDDGPTGYYDMTWEKYTGSSAYRPPIDTGGGTTTKDWLDMATPSEVETAVLSALTKWGAVLRSEGISGAGDRNSNGNAQITAAVKALGDSLRTEGISGTGDPNHNGNAATLAEQRRTNDLLTQLLSKLGA